MQLVEDFGVVGGAERVVHDLLSGLDQNQFQISVAICSPQVLPELFRVDGVTQHHLKAEGRLGIASVRELARTVRENRVDLVHSHLLKMNSLNGIVSVITQTPAVASIHGLLHHEMTSSARLYGTFAARAVDRTVAVSEVLRRQVIEKYHAPKGKVVAIHNGFDPARLSKPTADLISKTRSRLQLSEHSKVVVAIGNVKEVKGYRYLIEAIEILAQQLPEIRLLIAGDDASKSELGLEQLVRDRNLAKHVTFLGQVSDIASLFAVSNLYVCSSLHEGFSLTTVEAMASGLPVIVTASGGPEEIVGGAECGLVVPPANGNELAEAMRRIFSDSALSGKIAEAGKKRVTELFTLSRMIAKHSELYRQLV